MNRFDVEALELNPDIYLSGVTAHNGSYSSVSYHRQITKDGFRSLDISSLDVEDTENFNLSMICMPVINGKKIVESDLFTLKTYNYSKYELRLHHKIVDEEVQAIRNIARGNTMDDYLDSYGAYKTDGGIFVDEIIYIPYDYTVHYLAVTKADNKLTIDINEMRNEYTLDSLPMTSMNVFAGSGMAYVDKVFFSTGQVPTREKYMQLMPKNDISYIPHTTFTDWVFKYDASEPVLFNEFNCEYVDGYYTVGLPLFKDAANVLRNRSVSNLEISFNRAETWEALIDYRYLPASVTDVLIRTKDKDFELILDSFDKKSLNLAAAHVDIIGNVYPYHRDEPTYYTNAEYNFSEASLEITPIDEPIKTLEIFGKLSYDSLLDIGATNVVKNGMPWTPQAGFVDNVPHLYTLSVNWTEKKVLNASLDNFMCINAMGLSINEQTARESREVFDIFSRNKLVSCLSKIASVKPGPRDRVRIIDVQWDA